ncbi:mycofactocin-coupled SDR family oxidoreductase [Nocardioides sp. BP30]|uniref:mycofactocin-coupled SDR family oxidoreductase n=1 Tax=Nocardioides sp. BP30 TaxID=3036374 RepID=UPI0024682386|nr:mycofactocin-coupled SDR family oxidoreductase [Nocardioides sp. BP30]WGL54153.1 mycofactocin-coupled SDR family oxidoreductase [Nocardioides sp. BP30]
MTGAGGPLAGKVALVTGAARGQGRSHCEHLAAAGADIIAIDLAHQLDTVTYPMPDARDLAQTAAVVESLGRRIHVGIADVRDAGALSSVIEEGVRVLGGLDVVVANAGISGYGGVGTLTPDAWDTMIGVNLTGVWNTVNASIPHIEAGGRGGSLVLISSVGGLRGIPNLVHYTATKHAVVGMMRTLALEHAPSSIRVNTIHPTAVATEMIFNEVTMKLFRPDLDEPTLEDVRVAFGGNNALPVPWVEPSDVSKAVLFLVSDDARYITGVALPVDAGALLK